MKGMKYMKKTVKRTLCLLSLVVILVSVMTTFASATPSIWPSNCWHTGCFTYKIRATDSSSGTLMETVSKRKNRISPDNNYGRSDQYSYSVTGWMSMKTKSGSTGYVRRDMVCPMDRCYEVTSTSGLNIRSGVGTDKPVICSVSQGDFLELRTAQSGHWYYLRVRTGDYEGTMGYAVYDYMSQVNGSAVAQ